MNFFELIRYLELKKNMPKASASELMQVAGIDPDLENDCVREAQLTSRLEMAINQKSDKDAGTYYKILGIPKNDLTRYFQALEIISPGIVKASHIDGTGRFDDLCILKRQCAVNTASGTMTDQEIALDLDISIKEVQKLKTTLPAITPQMPGFEIVKQENRIREFFELYPYSTITEAAKALRMSNKEIRVIISDLTRHGEIIKYNNSPRPLEYEEKKLEVMTLKKADPMISDKDISESLGISINQVRQAVTDTIRLWQMEHAQQYDFFTYKTITELEKVKELAMERHNASNNSSSRWMEIYLQAEEKIIAIVGLKAPERVDITKNVTVSKEHRDKVVDAFMATDVIDVDFAKVEVTGASN